MIQTDIGEFSFIECPECHELIGEDENPCSHCGTNLDSFWDGYYHELFYGVEE